MKRYYYRLVALLLLAFSTSSYAAPAKSSDNKARPTQQKTKPQTRDTKSSSNKRETTPTRDTKAKSSTQTRQTTQKREEANKSTTSKQRSTQQKPNARSANKPNNTQPNRTNNKPSTPATRPTQKAAPTPAKPKPQQPRPQPTTPAAPVAPAQPRYVPAPAPVAPPRTQPQPAPSYAPSNNRGDADDLINSAMGFLGVAYRFGGTSPTGFDCSGFMQYIFRKTFAVNLPRTSAAQATVGTYVPRSELQPGDMVFFRTRGSSISHVGMYVGNDRFIHAPRTGKRIEITSLSNKYWNSKYATARRVKRNNAQNFIR